MIMKINRSSLEHRASETGWGTGVCERCGVGVVAHWTDVNGPKWLADPGANGMHYMNECRGTKQS